MFTGQMHTDFPRALYEIGADRDNRVPVLTGTGDRFMTGIDGPSLDDPTEPAVWDKTTAEGRRIIHLAWEETISGPAENGVHDMIGTRPIGQTVIRRARAAGLIVTAVERAGE